MLHCNTWYIGAWADKLGEQSLDDIASDANRIHMRRIVGLIVGEQSAVAAK
jgi:hypothetical protein